MATDTAPKSETALKQDVDQIRNDIEALRNDLAQLLKTTKAAAASRASGAKAYAEGEIEGLAERVRELTEEAKTEGRARLSDFEERVQERPLTSLAAAFGIGLIVGKLLDRR
ncbi:DUF883 family protein [Marinivivus vitaminiproducens]|uniref:DUF883 family protein n=1 Tax=Marinivivus vitaminiproducens TaxID=3035935 RepID=UPI00279ADBB5|nr:hypothetical protein P4R82_05510 [Geminicoccaceae bacterium SCSIO 64248]